MSLGEEPPPERVEPPRDERPREREGEAVEPAPPRAPLARDLLEEREVEIRDALHVEVAGDPLRPGAREAPGELGVEAEVGVAPEELGEGAEEDVDPLLAVVAAQEEDRPPRGEESLRAVLREDRPVDSVPHEDRALFREARLGDLAPHLPRQAREA